jgi:poly-beta-1,6-N-acetyl-D-glucosamine synthase
MDAPVVLLPVLLDARQRGELGKTLASFPFYFVLRGLNGLMTRMALVRECLLRQPLRQYENGH